MKIPKMEVRADAKDETDHFEDILCDKCGKSCWDKFKMNFEYAELEAVWGYGSGKDTEKHTAQICEPCYDGLGIKPKIEYYM